MRIRLNTIISLALAFVLAVAPMRSFAQGVVEVQSVFIYNFINYVKWPDTGSTTTLCVLGNQEIAQTLEKIRAKKTQGGGGKPFAVQQIGSPSQAGNCHVLYMDDSVGDSVLASAVQALGSRPILTVSNAKTFVQQGGMVSMEEKDNKPHLLINEKLARATGMQISSRLLSIADVVQ